MKLTKVLISKVDDEIFKTDDVIDLLNRYKADFYADPTAIDKKSIKIKTVSYTQNGVRRKACYSILPIDIYINYFGNPKIKTLKDTDLSKYLNDGTALKEHNSMVARTNIVFCKKKLLGYYTLRTTSIESGLYLKNDSSAYDNCNITKHNFEPVIELLMYARNDSNRELPMRVIFKKEILPSVRRICQQIGGRDLYLECEKNLEEAYKKLGFRTVYIIKDTKLIGMMRTVELN